MKYFSRSGGISEYCEAQSLCCGEIELDESYFDPRRVRGKRGRGAGNKTIVFGIFKRNGQVFTGTVPDAKKKTLLAVLRGRVSLGSVIHTDGWRAYDGLVDIGYEKHSRVNHGTNEFVGSGNRHINGYRIILGICKATFEPVQGDPETYILSSSEGDRVSFQSTMRRYLQEAIEAP